MESQSGFQLKKDVVYSELRDAILSGELKPGERIRQEQIADRMNVSPTPVREAIRQLESEGYLVHTPHHGVCVAEVTAAEVQEIYMIRGILESKATELAATNLDPKAMDELEAVHRELRDAKERGDLGEIARLNRGFHRTLYAASGRPILYDMIERLWAMIPVAAIGPRIEGRPQEIFDEHEGIMRAIRESNPTLAADKVKEHCDMGSKRVSKYFKGASSS